MKKPNLKKEVAKTVYMALREIYSMADIASAVGVAERTLYEWAKTEDWEKTATAMNNSKEEQLNYVFGQLKKLKDDTTDRLMTSKEADMHAKLIKAVNVLEDKTSLPNSIAVLKELALYTALHHTEKLDAIKAVISDFITSKSKYSTQKT